MNNPARITDLIARKYTGDRGLGTIRLDEAWRALLIEVPSIPTSVSSGLLTSQDVIDVLCAAAMRVLRNPEGYTEESGEVDDYRESHKLSDATQDLYFTAAELRRMRVLVVPTAGSQKYS